MKSIILFLIIISSSFVTMSFKVNPINSAPIFKKALQKSGLAGEYKVVEVIRYDPESNYSWNSTIKERLKNATIIFNKYGDFIFNSNYESNVFFENVTGEYVQDGNSLFFKAVTNRTNQFGFGEMNTFYGDLYYYNDEPILKITHSFGTTSAGSCHYEAKLLLRKIY